MNSSRVRAHTYALRALAIGALAVGFAAPASGQQRVVLPEGSVFTVQTDQALSSANTNPGATFNSTVTDSILVEGYPLIPAGSKVRGVVTNVRSATSQQSGVLALRFDRITLPNGANIRIDGKLTSTDPSERRQIESEPDTQVVLVGGRRGVGATIGGVRNPEDPVSSLLGAIGSLLSEGDEVRLPAGTMLAVQLDRGVVFRVRDARRTTGGDAFVIYTKEDLVRAAQEELRARDYYRGPVDGQLTTPTRRALLEFQIDNRILATGNLDGRTASALGLQPASSLVLSLDEATLVRREAQRLLGRYRDALGIANSQRLSPSRNYTSADLETYFALSALADNASLYEHMIRQSGHVEGVVAAGQALKSAAARVDSAVRSNPLPSRVDYLWESIQSTLGELDGRSG